MRRRNLTLYPVIAQEHAWLPCTQIVCAVVQPSAVCLRLCFLWLIVLWAMPLPGQQTASPRQTAILPAIDSGASEDPRARREILKKTTLSEAEQEVRLRVLEAALAGSVITPDDDNPEARNPKHWTIVPWYALSWPPKARAVEAIADLWIVHENDGVPVPRIWCYKYSSLTLVQGYIRYFRDTGNTAGLAALNKLIGHKEFPAGLPNEGEGLLWKRRCGERQPAAGRPGLGRESVLRSRPRTDSPRGLSTGDQRRQVAQRSGGRGRRDYRILRRRRRRKQHFFRRRPDVDPRGNFRYAALSQCVAAT